MTGFISFPKNFQWGTATSAYQIEGAVDEDGRAPSIWDEFAHRPGIIKDGDTGDVACDHYHLWKQDLALMKELGCQAYRFSIAWPRILPNGSGKINQPGIDFYNRLIDELLRLEITPFLTLYHWDLPTAIPNAWLNRDVIHAFAEFSAVAARAFGDRVKNWITLNEPLCSAYMGYTWGQHAPGITDPYKGLLVSHHLNLAHGLSVKAIRQNCVDAEIGIAVNPMAIYPKTDSEADRRLVHMMDGFSNRWFLDPLYKGAYPMDILQTYVAQGILPSTQPDFIQPGDMEIASVPFDFLGINYYTRQVYHHPEGQPFSQALMQHLPAPADRQTEMGWEIYPQGLTDLLLRLSQDYHPRKMYITENGASYTDQLDASGRIIDQRRIDYFISHLEAVHKAIQAGAPVEGYFAWSFMDNFEWKHGYSQRFGLVDVNFETQKRTPRESAYWFSRVIKENGFQK